MSSHSLAQPSRLGNALAVVGALVAYGIGRVLGWTFGLQLVVPLVAAAVGLGVYRQRMRPSVQRFGVPLALLVALSLHAILGVFVFIVHVVTSTGHFTSGRTLVFSFVVTIALAAVPLFATKLLWDAVRDERR